MAFIIHKNPSHYNFSKSPVMVEIETDNAIVSGDFGNKSKFVIYVFSNPANNNSVQFSTSLITINFLFTNGVNPLVWTISLKSGSQSLASYYAYVLARMQANTGVSNRYIITYIGGGGFLFEAILPGAQDNLLTKIATGSGMSITRLQNGSTNNLVNYERENYKISIELYQEKSATFPLNLSVFDKIYSAQKIPFNNKVRFDLSKILDANLEYYFPIPNQYQAVNCSQVLKKFYVSIKEYYGTPSIEHAVSISPSTGLQSGTNNTLPAFLLKAGLSPRNNKVLPTFQLDGYIWSYPLYLTTKPFNAYYIKLNQPEYLFFALPLDYPSETLALKIITTFENGSTSTVTQSNYPAPHDRGTVICFPVNFAGGNIYDNMSVYPSIQKFTVSIVSLSNVTVDISSPIIYYPIYEEMGEDRVFLFTNSMGGVDTFRSVGNYENTPEFESDTSNRNYSTDDASHLGMNASNQAYVQETFKVFSGWRSKDEIDWIEELYLAKYKVEVIDSLTYEPIIITSKKYRKHKTNEFLKGIEFEYYHQSKSPVTNRLAAGL